MIAHECAGPTTGSLAASLRLRSHGKPRADCGRFVSRPNQGFRFASATCRASEFSKSGAIDAGTPDDPRSPPEGIENPTMVYGPAGPVEPWPLIASCRY